MANYTPYSSMGTPTAFAFGGGNIGPSPSFFQFTEPTFLERSLGRTQTAAELKPNFLSRPNPITGQMQGGINLLPAGALSRQEIRNRQDVQQILRSGRPYVEAPTQYVLQRDRRGLPKYVDPITGRSMGTIAAEWAGGTGKKSEERKKEKKPPSDPPPPDPPPPEGEPRKDKPIPQTAMGFSGEAMAFTPFGAAIGVRPTLASPYAGGFKGLTGFGGIPSFPFSGY